MTGEGFGDPDPDVENAESKDQAPEVAGLTRMEPFQQVLGGLFAHTFECQEIGLREPVEIGDIVCEVFLNELSDEHFATAFDVHGGAGAPMLEATADLSWAIWVEAAEDDIWLAGSALSGGGARAFGAEGGKFERDFGAGAFIGDDADDGWDDLAGFFDDDDIAYADIFPAEFIFVVEGGAADGATGEVDGFEFGDGGESACAADLDGDGAEAGFGLFGGVFVGDRPAWELGCVACTLAERYGIELNDGTIGFVIETFTSRVEALDGIDEFIGRIARPEHLWGFESERTEPCDEMGVGDGRGVDLAFAEPVEDGVERAGSDDAGVELFERAGGSVSRISEGFFAIGGPLGVEFFETTGGEEDFAAYFYEGGWERG